MITNPLTPNLIHLLSKGGTRGTTGRQSDNIEGNFANVLRDTFRDASDMDRADKMSALELLSGTSDDFSGLLIDVQKAELSLNLALQIRNKVIDAYNEVMRMSV